MGTVLRYDGTSWTREPFVRNETFGALLVRSAELWVGGSLRSSYVMSSEPLDGGPSGWIQVAEPSDPFAVPNVGINGLWAAPGSRWVWAALACTSPEVPSLVRLERSGRTLESHTVVASSYAMYGVDGLTAGEVWAVGEHGSAHRVAGAESATPLVSAFNTQTENTLYAVDVVAPDDVWAVGSVGTIRRYRGGGLVWDRVASSPTTSALRAVKAVSASDVWAVGDDATIVHFDGETWTRYPVAALGGGRPSLRAVLPLDSEHVWVAGDRIVLVLRPGNGG